MKQAGGSDMVYDIIYEQFAGNEGKQTDTENRNEEVTTIQEKAQSQQSL